MTSERNPLDRYDSPDFMTLALLEQHPDIGGKLCVDPCCGDGRMAALLAPRFKQMLLNDIDRSVEAHSYGDARNPRFYVGLRPDWVITNPPFCDATVIVRLAIEAAQVGVAMLLRCTFLEPVNARAWLADCPPTELISLPRYRWKGPGQGTDQAPVWWFLWRKGSRSACPVVSKEHAAALQRAARNRGASVVAGAAGSSTKTAARPDQKSGGATGFAGAAQS